MQSLPLDTSLTVSPTNTTTPSSSKSSIPLLSLTKKQQSPFFPSMSSFRASHDSLSFQIRATQIVDLFLTVSSEIVVHEALLEDCWELAETHCSSFFPEYSFPLDFVLRVDTLVAMLSGFSIHLSFRRTCLVVVIGSSVDDTLLFGSEDLKIRGFDRKYSLNKGYVIGILAVDTVADFLPRKGPLRQQRTGIPYISNVVVRERFCQKGIAKRLIAKAEAQART